MRSAHQTTLPITAIALLCIAAVSVGCSLQVPVAQRLDQASESLQKGDYRAAAIRAKKVLQSHGNNAQAWLVLARASLAQERYADAVHQFRKARDHGISSQVLALAMAKALLAHGEPEAALKVLTSYDAPGETAHVKQLTRQGKAYLAMEQLDKAAQAYTNALELKPDYAPALVGRAKTALHRGHLEQALNHLDHAVKAHPHYLPAILTLGKLAYRRDNCQKAQSEFQYILDSKGGQLDTSKLLLTRALLASCQLQMGEHQKAKANLTHLLKIAPRNPYTNYLQALLEVQSGDYKQAAQNLQTALVRAPNSVRVLLLMAAVKIQLDKPTTARLYLKQVLEQSPAQLDALRMLSMLYMRSNQTDKALRMLELVAHAPASSTNPARQAAVAILRSNALFYAGQQRAGIKALRQAVEAVPTNTRYRFVLALAELAIGDTSAAIKQLKTLRQNAPAFIPAAVKLAEIQLEQGDLQAALATAASLGQGRNPNEVAAATLKGQIHAVLGQYAQASKAYQTAFSAQPSRRLALWLFITRRRAGSQDPARSLVAWLEANPHDTRIALQLAQWLQHQGHTARARKRYRTIINQSGKNAIALNNLALIEAQRDSGKAMALAQRAHKAAPDNPAIADTLGWLLVQQGQLAKGLELLQKAAGASSQPGIRYHFAYALAQTQQPDNLEKAKQILNNLLDSDVQFASRQAAKNLQTRLLEKG